MFWKRMRTVLSVLGDLTVTNVVLTLSSLKVCWDILRGRRDPYIDLDAWDEDE